MEIDILMERDLPFINEIINMPQVRRFFNFIPPLAFQQTKKWFKEVIEKRRKKQGECFIVRIDDKTVGWCYGFLNVKIERKFFSILKPYLKKINRKHLGYLAAIVVNPNYSGKGIGSILLDRLHKYLKSIGAKAIWLGVNSDNISAKKFYEKFEYKLIGCVKDFKTRGDDIKVNQDIYLKYFS